MMKNSKDQLERLLKGCPYHIYTKTLRSDDPANHSHHGLSENRVQKKKGSYFNYDHENFYANTIHNTACKTNENNDSHSMYVIRFATKKGRIDINEMSVFVNSRGISTMLFRKINGGRKPESYIISIMGENFAYQPQLDRIEGYLNQKIRDALVWSDFETGFDSKIIHDVVLYYDTMCDDPGLILVITTNRVSDASELPTLSKLNKALDGLEKIVRDSLE